MHRGGRGREAEARKDEQAYDAEARRKAEARKEGDNDWYDHQEVVVGLPEWGEEDFAMI